MYSYLKSYWSSPEKPTKGKLDPETATTSLANDSEECAILSESTSLLLGNDLSSAANGGKDSSISIPVDNGTHTDVHHADGAGENNETDEDDDDPVHPVPKQSPTVYDFYFDKTRNPTVQRYYRFHATPITPIVALHKKPGPTGGTPTATGGHQGVTGLLRRSAVVPSHGTDVSGDWILVSVGGRSGWARKKLPQQHFSGFTLADEFAATEGWMGNHAFMCGGKCMLGSDAPSLVFTNVLILVGYLWHFLVVLPRLEQMEVAGHFNWHVKTLFWWSVALGTTSVITLWISALMDPGIIPPVSSPVKAPIPDGVVLGGPVGYRYCSTCNIFRPPRSKHCNSCNVCVSKFDQYVSWRSF